jgi:hypothetical protein
MLAFDDVDSSLQQPACPEDPSDTDIDPLNWTSQTPPYARTSLLIKCDKLKINIYWKLFGIISLWLGEDIENNRLVTIVVCLNFPEKEKFY